MKVNNRQFSSVHQMLLSTSAKRVAIEVIIGKRDCRIFWYVYRKYLNQIHICLLKVYLKYNHGSYKFQNCVVNYFFVCISDAAQHMNVTVST